MSDTDTCQVCGRGIPEEYGKFDPHTPVYGPEDGQVHHLACEDELFEDVRAALSDAPERL